MDLEQQRILVRKSQEDINAFGELYDEYYPKIFNYVLRRTASIDIAQEVTSIVFFKALENIGRFEWRGVPFSAWLYRIASNEMANYHRGNGHKEYRFDEVSGHKTITVLSASGEVVDVEAEMLRHEDFLALHEHISQLPLKYQEVITLRFFEDKQIGEIGEILRKPEGTVKSLLHRGLEKLRERMA
jgi:RNA polymerase sigma-70 factor (ECF subfamily)